MEHCTEKDLLDIESYAEARGQCLAAAQDLHRSSSSADAALRRTVLNERLSAGQAMWPGFPTTSCSASLGPVWDRLLVLCESESEVEVTRAARAISALLALPKSIDGEMVFVFRLIGRFPSILAESALDQIDAVRLSRVVMAGDKAAHLRIAELAAKRAQAAGDFGLAIDLLALTAQDPAVAIRVAQGLHPDSCWCSALERCGIWFCARLFEISGSCNPTLLSWARRHASKELSARSVRALPEQFTAALIDSELAAQFVTSDEIENQSGWARWLSDIHGLLRHCPALLPAVWLPLVARLNRLWLRMPPTEAVVRELLSIVAFGTPQNVDDVVGLLGHGLASEAAISPRTLRGFQRRIADSEARKTVVGQVMDSVWVHVQLWDLISRLGQRQDTDLALLGLERQLADLAALQLSEWVRSLPALLSHGAKASDYIASVCVNLAQEPGLRAALVDYAASDDAPTRSRDEAWGILTLLEGYESSRFEASTALLASILGRLNARPVLPHPLSGPSATWLGGPLEVQIRQIITQAQSGFQLWFGRQGRIEEEAVTAILLDRLATAFGSLTPQVLSGLGMPATIPRMIAVMHRLVPKAEEKTYQCDVALWVNVHIANAVTTEYAELVQVKKLRSKSAQQGRKEQEQFSFGDSWDIDTRQLQGLLDYSKTAVYFLIDENGHTGVLPAKLIAALLRADGRIRQGSAAIRRMDVQWAVIPLQNFLTDLLLGAWLGTDDERTLQFAKGQNARTSPSNILEIQVAVGPD